MNQRRIVVRTRTGWRDVLVEERPLAGKRRRGGLNQPFDRLIEKSGELSGTIAGRHRRFRLHVHDDGCRTWVPA